MKVKERFDFLDILRGLAAALVIFAHMHALIFGSGVNLEYKAFFDFGRCGVFVFFLVSGFVIPLSLERGNSLGRFWTSRVFRLYPAYWFALILSLTLLSLGENVLWREFNSYTTQHGFFFPALINFFMIQLFAGVPDMLGAAWTLEIELVFYIAYSLLFALQLHKKTVSLIYSSSALMIFASVLSLALHKRVPFGGLSTLCSCSIGLSIYRYYEGCIDFAKLWLPFVFFSVSFIFGAYISYYQLPKGLPDDVSFIAVVTSFFLACTLFGSAFYFRQKLKQRLLRWFGRISYSMYLLHPIPILYCQNLPYGVNIVAALLLILLLSEFSYRFVEEPCILFGKRVWQFISQKSD